MTDKRNLIHSEGYKNYIQLKEQLEVLTEKVENSLEKLQFGLWFSFGKEKGVEKYKDLFISDQECHKSPIGVCFYDNWKDLEHECCLICSS